jgi:DNA-binding CsgD family transcriptional regulator
MVLAQSDFLFVGGGLVILAIYCLDMLIMLVSTDVAFRTRTPVAFTFGLTIIVARCGTLVGTLGYDVASSLSGVASGVANLDGGGAASGGADLGGFGSLAAGLLGQPSQLLLICAIVAILAGTLLFSEADLLKLYRVRATSVQPRAPAQERCEHIAEICGLTARELEVLVLLGAGRSIPFISQELTIARGTTKHHVSNIYRKLGVGDRQGLHDVIEQGGAGKGALEPSR